MFSVPNSSERRSVCAKCSKNRKNAKTDGISHPSRTQNSKNRPICGFEIRLSYEKLSTITFATEKQQNRHFEGLNDAGWPKNDDVSCRVTDFARWAVSLQDWPVPTFGFHTGPGPTFYGLRQ
jgi:hypothetical protein